MIYFWILKPVVHIDVNGGFGSFINHTQQGICKHFSGDIDNWIKTQFGYS